MKYTLMLQPPVARYETDYGYVSYPTDEETKYKQQAKNWVLPLLDEIDSLEGQEIKAEISYDYEEPKLRVEIVGAFIIPGVPVSDKWKDVKLKSRNDIQHILEGAGFKVSFAKNMPVIYAEVHPRVLKIRELEKSTLQ